MTLDNLHAQKRERNLTLTTLYTPHRKSAKRQCGKTDSEGGEEDCEKGGAWAWTAATLFSDLCSDCK